MVEAEKQAEVCTRATGSQMGTYFCALERKCTERRIGCKKEFTQAKAGFDRQRETLENAEQEAVNALEHAF